MTVHFHLLILSFHVQLPITVEPQVGYETSTMKCTIIKAALHINWLQPCLPQCEPQTILFLASSTKDTSPLPSHHSAMTSRFDKKMQCVAQLISGIKITNYIWNMHPKIESISKSSMVRISSGELFTGRFIPPDPPIGKHIVGSIHFVPIVNSSPPAFGK